MKIIVVDDEDVQRKALAGFLKKNGFDTHMAGSFEEALKEAKEEFYDIAIIDLRLGESNGIELLQELLRINPLIKGIIITAFGTIDTAVDSMKAGAVEFLTKPVDLKELLSVIATFSETIGRERLGIMRSKKTNMQDAGFIYRSQVMDRVLQTVFRAAKTNAPILITGESGTGKEEIAKLIHRVSARVGPFIPVSCAAIPENLLESELFGYKKGAFTGAEKDQKGKIELAEGGTLFLDEIGEMPPILQAKLLRFLESGEYWPLGSDRALKSNVRIVTATNRELKSMIDKGVFREDLFYRINTVHIHLPPLRERREDIIPIAEHFLKKFSIRHNKDIKGFTRQAKYFLIVHPLRGNVRELKNLIERAVILSDKRYIDVRELSDKNTEDENVLLSLEDVEKEHIKNVLLMTQGNIKEAAEILGIHRNTLSQKIKKYFKNDDIFRRT